MKLSLKMIALGLTTGDVQIVSTRRTRPDQMRLNTLMLWNREAIWDFSVCYVIDAGEIGADFHCPDSIALIVLGSADPSRFADADADILIWNVPRSEMTFREQFNHLSRVFWYYCDMESRLLLRLAEGGSLQELIGFGDNLFRNPLVLLDGGFSLLLQSRKQHLLEWDQADPSHVPALSAETVEQIRLSPEFRGRELNDGLFTLSDEILNCRALLLQIPREQQSFYLAVMETEHPLREGHDQLLRFFSDFVSYALRSRRFSKAKATHLEDLIGRMLSGTKIDRAQINRQLHPLHWKNTDQYLCFVLDLDLWHRKDIDSYSICRMVEAKFPNIYAVFHQEQVICIANLEQSGIRRDAFEHLLAPYVRDQLFHAGISYVFSDFSALVNYYRQALAALEFGRQKAPDAWFYRFEKYALDYFTRYGTSRIEGRYLCHPALMELHQYDQANNTCLLQTLRTYLNCGQNATTTAAELYIHRNTLYQRMSKIESLIQVKLSDPAVQLYLQISLTITDFPEAPHTNP